MHGTLRSSNSEPAPALWVHQAWLFGRGRARRGGARQLAVLKGLRVDDDLNDKVLLDLGVLEPRLIREQLPGEEPALVCRVDIVLGLQLLLELPDRVAHASAETQIFARGESNLRGEENVNIRILIWDKYCDEMQKTNPGVHFFLFKVTKGMH